MADTGNRHRYIVGLDFGTTYTGISYVPSNKKTIQDIHVIRNWPGPSKEANEVWKTPSKIAYRIENVKDGKDELGSDTEIWGYKVLPAMNSYSWMKLYLDKDSQTTEFDDTTLDRLSITLSQGIMRLPIGKDATQVCGDYLKGVYEYFMSELQRKHGFASIKMTPCEFWLTVPATWSDKAKNSTKEAATRAGIGSREGDKIFLITEPEAAAVAALSNLIAPGVNNQVKAGDGILVCDCGGGTVDINTYIIKSTTPKLDFEELVVGQGGKIGSTYIDRQFHSWMSSRFGPDFDDLDMKKKGPGSRFMKEFESLKRDFGGIRNQQTNFEIPLVMAKVDYSENYDVEESVVKFTKADMENFFKPSVSKIQKLLEAQISKGNKAMPDETKIEMIILVGGFGDSQYLNDALQNWCEKNGGLKLLCPEHPQAAIVKGAALRGLDDIKPSIRRCRRHYGFPCMLQFRPGIDPKHLATVDQWSGMKMCKDRMHWQIEKGDPINEETFISTKVGLNFREGDSLTNNVKLFASNSDTLPVYAAGPAVYVVGVIKWTLPKDSLGGLKSKRRNGKKIYRLEYTVEVMLGAKEGLLKFRVKVGDEVVGETEIDFSKG